jgi:excisionase family DNA binding protein
MEVNRLQSANCKMQNGGPSPRPSPAKDKEEGFAQLELFAPRKDLPDKTLFRADEVAAFFGVNRKTIYNWVECGKLSACKPNGGALRIFRDSIVAAMNTSLK